MADEDKRVRRSVEERVAELDAKITAHKDAIAKLEAKKHDLLNPKPRLTKAQKMKLLIDKAGEKGLSPEDIAEKLGITLN